MKEEIQKAAEEYASSFFSKEDGMFQLRFNAFEKGATWMLEQKDKEISDNNKYVELLNLHRSAIDSFQFTLDLREKEIEELKKWKMKTFEIFDILDNGYDLSGFLEDKIKELRL